MSRFKVSTLIIAIFVVGCVGEKILLAALCDANSTEPDFFVHGLCFSPYIDGQAPPDYVPAEQIEQRLDIVTRKYHTDWIRTYSATNGLQKIPELAKTSGLKVAMGIWTRDNKQQEIDNLVIAAQAGYVDIAVVGNEELYAGATSEEQLINDINDVRQRLIDVNCADIPVTTPEPFDTLFAINGEGRCEVRHYHLIKAVDVVFVNIYPFHDGHNIDIALQDLALRYQCAVEAIHRIDPNKPVIIAETGWTSDGSTTIDAEPSLSNLARYFSEVAEWSADNNVQVFYFEAFDEKWKSPPETEAHWGIWDSQGNLKRSFVEEPVLCETFDPPVNPYYVERHWSSNAPEPNVLAGDPDYEGNFLRLLYDGTGETHYSYVAFDRVAVGLYPRIEATFDFRMYGPDDYNDADGFSFMLIPTLLNDTNGTSGYGSYPNFFAEEPKLSKVFAIGFEVWKWPPGQPCDRIYISWDGEWFPEGEPIDVSIDLDNGAFHRAIIELRSSGDDSLLTFTIEPNIYQPNAADPLIIAENLRIPGLKPYENRVEFIGRCGWWNRDINTDIDNIKVTYKPQICDCFLPADLNQDCEVNLEDVAVLANDWLRTCDSNDGSQEECFPASHPDYDNWVTVGRPECWCCPTQCHGDTNCDGVVDDSDLSPIEPLINTVYPSPAYDPCFDIDHDLAIYSTDLDIILTAYGTTPPTDCLTIP